MPTSPLRLKLASDRQKASFLPLSGERIGGVAGFEMEQMGAVPSRCTYVGPPVVAVKATAMRLTHPRCATQGFH